MKHNNKYWLKEKFYISLQKEEDSLYNTVSWRHGGRSSEIESILRQKFYGKYCGRYNSAPGGIEICSTVHKEQKTDKYYTKS